MIDATQRGLIEQIHDSPYRLVLSITGGGTEAISALLDAPRASQTILEADVPYSYRALADKLRCEPEQACSERTARALAMVAFQRAIELASGQPQQLRGVAATASLATSRPKRGAHRLHVAWQSAERTVAYSYEFMKRRRSRDEEQRLSAQFILGVVAEACELDPPKFPSLCDEPVTRREKSAPPPWQQLLLDRQASRAVGWNCSRSVSASPAVLFPGAFNPLHDGHLQMAEIAAERCNSPVVFELSIRNVDKPPLDFLEIDDRLRQFAERPVWLTAAATFVEKASLAPGCTFVVGADTIARIGDPHYYEDSVSRRDAAVRCLFDAGCRFLVFGRSEDGRFRQLANLDLPEQLRDLCTAVAEAEFRDDISSTKLRLASSPD